MSIVTPERPVDAAGAPTPSRPHRTWWHALNSVIALGAATLGVIALTRDPATKTVEVSAPAVVSPYYDDPGPTLGIPSDSYADGGSAAPATGGVPSDKYADLVPATGGVPSDKYADRVPAYQYDIAQQHAPVSPVGH